jgi:hypothetical protein
MSLLGFDALGRLALGQIRRGGQQTFSLQVDPGALALSPQSVPFVVAEAAPTGVLSISPVVFADQIFDKAEIGSLSLASVPVSLGPLLNPLPGGLSVSGSLKFTTFETALFGNLALTADVPLSRTGFDYNFQQGGIGHFLYERERARHLAAITRTIPAPIDRRSAPTFKPVPRPYSAPIAPAPDLAAIENERMVVAAAQAQATKKRRELEAILLLAS